MSRPASRGGRAGIGRRVVQGLAVGAIAAAAAAGLGTVGWLDGAENLAWTMRVRAAAEPGAATPSIKLILLDQASLEWGETVNRWGWPWPREALAAIIDFCADAGAAAFAADVILSESAVHDVYQDEILAEAIDRAENVATAVALGMSGGAHPAWPAFAPLPPEIAGLPEWRRDRDALQAARATFPVPEIARVSAALGNVTAAADAHAEITRVPVFRLFDGHPVPGLGLAAYLAAEPEADLAIRGGWLHAGPHRLPLDEEGRTILRYRGPPSVYPSYSAAAVLQAQIHRLDGQPPALDPAVFKDAWVFYGYSAPGLRDLRPTPLSPKAPGVSVNATLLDNLLASDAIRDGSARARLLCVLLPALAAGGLIRLGGRARHSVLVILAALPIPTLVGLAGYRAGVWLPVAAPTLAVLGSVLGSITLNYATEGRARAFIKSAFGHYLSPTVIEQILADPTRLRLGGERRVLTILFSDLEGFSAISEQMDPRDLIGLLNDYLSDMTAILLDEHGTLDKYEGDAIIAFWNAPLDQADHAARACRAALRCQAWLAERREEFRRRSGHDLRMRIGIHTGPVAVGNMGSHERFDYTVLGDAANLASRLEGANKVFGTYTLVSEAAWSAAGDVARGRALGGVRVVGRSAPVRVYELTPSPPPGFAEALRAFEAGDLAAAADRFAALAGDPPSAAYLRRCRAEDAGNEGWEPVWTLSEK